MRSTCVKLLARATRFVAFSWLGLVLAARPCRAGDTTYTRYEADIIAAQLRRSGGVLEENPEGKIITRIDVVRLDVFDESDPVPDVMNIFHTTTRERVIRRELLFREGQAYSAQRVDETARNFRLLRQLSLVLIVPVNDGQPDRVRVLVITKDVWSLRLNSDFEVAGSRLQYLLLNPSEENLFGTHASVGGMFVLQPYTYAVGVLASHKRIFGTRFAASASYNSVFNRDTGDIEGSYGSFIYSLPQYSAEQKWAFSTGILWSDTLARIGFETDAGPRVFVYDTERYVGGTEVKRSFGLVYKLDFTVGVEADRRAYRSRIPAGTDSELARRVQSQIPISDTRFSPFVQLESYENRFLKTVELETLGLQEDYRLGHESLLRLYPASTHLGSSRDLLGVQAGVSYTVALGDGIARVLASSTIEYARDDEHQSLTELSARVASPRLGLGRFVFDALLLGRAFNYLNRRYVIGGDGRLRGYPLGDAEVPGAESQRGSNVLALNTEFRTRGIDILSAQCGLALFHDTADAADSLTELSLKHSVGLGLRMLFPQADRTILRADWAMPLSDGESPWPGGFFVTFEQAFGFAGLVAPTLETRYLE